MNSTQVWKAWGHVLTGRLPALAIEVTRECPLRCPGCYAYEEAHLGGTVTLRQLADHKGNELVEGILQLVERYRPLHVSLVGGDPLVRYRELEVLLPQLNRKGIHTQVVTSAFRPIPASWAALENVRVTVSIDGLQPEHDVRRKPATYERILKNIVGHRVIIHCTITGQMMKRPGYLEEFLEFWSPRQETRKIWMSTFTPQRGDNSPECLSAAEREQVVEELLRLRKIYPKLKMGEGTIREFSHPPQSPRECLFAQTTRVLSADLKTGVAPCQIGGDPDCSRCGCMASMGLAAVGHYQLVGSLTIGKVFNASMQIGRMVAKLGLGDAASEADTEGLEPGKRDSALPVLQRANQRE
jgi:MoaA/NifB/PqqE/SkfB family radical SAM enzyme